MEKLWTIKDVAEYYNVDEKTIRRRIHGSTPKLGHIRDGAFIRFKQKHLDDYDRRHEVKPVF